MRRLRFVYALMMGAAGLMSCTERDLTSCDATHACATADRPYCDLLTHICLAMPLCQTSCDMGGADLMYGCTDHAECTTATAPICDAASHACQGCKLPSECGAIGGSRPLCNVDTGACVECLEAKDCLSSGKTCDTSSGACVPCSTNEQCESRLCNAKTGACADPSTVVYVDAAGPSCPGGAGQGTRAEPYCGLQKGFDQGATLGKTVVVFAGTYGPISIVPGAGASYTVSAVGVGDPTIMPTAGAPAVMLTAGSGTSINVTLDGLILRGATGAMGHGILCQGIANTSATKLKLVRSTVANNAQLGISATTCDVTLDQDVIGPANAQGGILFQSSDFTLTNLLVVGNGRTGPSGSNFGGINIGSLGTGRANIINTTVVNNNAKPGAQASGLTCAAQPAIINSVFIGNAGPLVSPDLNAVGCLPDHSSFVGASAFGTGTNNQDLTTCGANATAVEGAIFTSPATSDYHAKTGGTAPCTLVGLGTSTGAPSVDLDGKTRPTLPSIGCLEPK